MSAPASEETPSRAARAAVSFAHGPLAAATQHLLLLQDKRDRLTNAMVDSQLQFLAELGRQHQAGLVTYTELRDAYDLLAAAKIPGLERRWYASIPISPQRVRARAAQEPAEADGSWRGSNPIAPGETYPLMGQSVVYVLFTADHAPVYVGSTKRFKIRMEQHRKAGKVWRYWLAHPCRDRDHAYEVESRFLRQYMPELNVQGPRR